MDLYRNLIQQLQSPWAKSIAESCMQKHALFRTQQLDRLNRLKLAKVQNDTLFRLIRTARNTKFGRDHFFDRISTIAEFQSRVPLREYEELWQEYWQPTFPFLENATWPGYPIYFALSSGTTTGTTKYIPVSNEMLASNRKAAFTTTALYRSSLLKHYKRPRLMQGRFFFLGGSTELKAMGRSLAGDLSGIAAREVNDLVRSYTFPPLDIALMADWEKKLITLAEKSSKENITAISGVPSWLLKLFDVVLQHSGKKQLCDVWPNLELVVHGGTIFEPYRNAFQQTIGNPSVSMLNVYPCSEGFVATEDPRYNLLRIIPDHQIFFEFVPVSEWKKSINPTRHTLANAELGVEYVVVMSTCAGCWAYVVGDTIRFESINPPLIQFTGRTKYFLSAFGEHLIQEEVDSAVSKAAQQLQVNSIEHHVGPIFPNQKNQVGHHHFIVELRGQKRCDAYEFAKIIDQQLCQRNEDYAAHRMGDLTIGLPVVQFVDPGTFERWMASRGKAGGQNKVPRMDNTGKMTGEICDFIRRQP